MKNRRRARTLCLAFAVGLQSFGAFGPGFFVVTIPVGFALVLAATICQRMVNEALVPPRSRLANAGATLLTFVGGGTAYASAILGASALAAALARHAT